MVACSPAIPMVEVHLNCIWRLVCPSLSCIGRLSFNNVEEDRNGEWREIKVGILSARYEYSEHIFFLQDFWDWSWQELALYDAAEMIHNINIITSSKIFIVGHSQVPTTFLFS